MANIITGSRILLSILLLFLPPFSSGFYAIYLIAGLTDMIIKIINMVSGFVFQKKLVAVHTLLNKAAGLLLFLLPLTVTFIPLVYSATIVCMIATLAAIQEGHIIRTGLLSK